MDDLENFFLQNRETLAQLADALDCTVWVNNNKGDIIFVNKAVKAVFGENAADLIGRNAIHLADNGLVSEQAMVETLRTKKVARRFSVSKIGQKVLLTSYPLMMGNNRIRFVIGIGKAEESMDAGESGEKAEEANEKPGVNPEEPSEEFIVASDKMRTIMASLPRLAQSEATVMISGETGVGKDGVAYQIHKLSSRSAEPYIIINCATLPENLIESELFGYEKGAFTHAFSSKRGLLEMANNGTVFLDEVGDMPPFVQVKLLRCIQNRQIMRVGGTKMLNLNVRFITATNQSLEDMVQVGKFREDLYYRLNVVNIKIPPLRERLGDILPLTAYFVRIFNQKYNTTKRLSRAALRCIQGYSWPGNVRELRNAVEHAVVMCPYAIIGSEFMPAYIAGKENISEKARFPTLKEARRDCEQSLLAEVMRECHSTRRAAEVLGCNQATVVRKLQQYGMA